jgi:hypothetical protein
MKRIVVYLFRGIVCWLGCAAILRLVYGPPTQYDQDVGIAYIVVCTILTGCAFVAWLVSRRGTLPARALTAATVGLVLSIGLIQVSAWKDLVFGLPWQYFYKDDGISLFPLIAPLSVSVLAGLLRLIPERSA